MKTKLAVALTLLSSLAFAGPALADRVPGYPAPAPVLRHPPAPIVVQAPPRAPIAPARWDVLATKAASARHGSFTLRIAGRASYDQLRLVASARSLDITAVQLTYANGRTELVRPALDGMVNLDLARGKLKSITVRYTSRGFARGASIKVMAKDDAPSFHHR